MIQEFDLKPASPALQAPTGQIRAAPPVLQSSHLWLSPLSPEDAGALVGVFNHENTVRQTHELRLPFTFEEAQAFITRAETAPLKFPVFGIRTSGSGLVGVIYLSGRSCSEDSRLGPNLSVFIAPEHQGKGLGTEAIETLVLWLKARRITHVLQAAHFADNAASAAMLERADFLYTGRVTMESSGLRDAPAPARHMIRLI